MLCELTTPWCLRASVLRSTPYCAAIWVYTSYSPGSHDSIAASAASIELMLIQISRVEVLVLHEESGHHAGPGITPGASVLI